MNCGTDSGQHNGAWSCQLSQDMFVKIVFDVDVEMISDCARDKIQGPKKVWTWQTPKGDCRYYFKAQDGRRYRFWLYGFEQTPIRN